MRPTGSTFTYTMQSKSSDGLNQAGPYDIYTVSLTSIDADVHVFVATATPVSGNDGQYTADLQVTQGGTYKVLVTMENASTRADPEISTIVSVNDLTLVITDFTSVPSRGFRTTDP